MKIFIHLVTISLVLISQTIQAQWVRSGKSNDSFYSFTSTPNKGTGGTNLFAGSNSTGVYLSTDDGSIWTATGGSFGSVRGLAALDSFVFAAGYTIFVTNDNAKNWTKSTMANIDPAALAICDSVVFAGTFIDGIFKYSNIGNSWTSVNSGLRGSDLAITALFNSDSCLFAGTWGSGVLRSTNNGASWTAVNNGIVNHVHAFAVASNGEGGTNLFAGTYDGEGVYLSTNNGESWTAVSIGMTKKNVRSLAISSDGAGGINLFAGTDGGGVFLSKNYGSSWTAFNTGMTSTIVNALYVSGSYLFAGTNNGIWRRPLSDLTTNIEQINSDASGFGLEQNYPNPFYTSTKIGYQIPTSEDVSLKVYNMLGKEVSTLVNEKKPAGSYDVEFVTQGLPAGVYIYYLRVGNSTKERKMILLKSLVAD